MKLCDWRKEYEEYDDLTDEEVLLEFDVEPDDEEEIDTVTPALHEIEEKLECLCDVVRGIVIPDKSADVLALLKQIKNGLGSLEVAIGKIDVNVTTTAPVVKVPAPIVQELKLPEPIKEWTFEIIRNRNGYIQEVVARA